MAPGARIIDHRGDEVGSGDNRSVVVEFPHCSVVAGVGADEEFVRVIGFEMAHDVRQFARGELAASTGAVTELRQPNPVPLVVVVMHVCPLPGIVDPELSIRRSSTGLFWPKVEVDHQLVGDVFKCFAELIERQFVRNSQRGLCFEERLA